MKNLYTALLMLLTTAIIFAQVPQKISYQSVIRNASNVLISNTAVGMKVSLLQGGSNGVSVYSETHTPTTNANGLVSLAIGTGAVVEGVFADVDWSTGSYFVKTEIDPLGGVNYTLIGTSELLSVPFALHAKTAGTSNDSELQTKLAQLQEQITELQNNAALPNVTIGTQMWSSTNLDVTTYRDGTPIPQVTDPVEWFSLTTGAWCYYNNNPDSPYGKLYNWYAVAGIHDADPNTPNKILAPSGWHVPSDEEWTTLTTFLGGNTVAGGKMKSAGTIFWSSPNTYANNSSGFAGLPGGYRNDDGPFAGTIIYGMFWSSSELSESTAWYRSLYYTSGAITRDYFSKKYGFSVRCIRD